MRVVITGAAGLVGTHLANAYAGHDVVALRHRDLDITDSRAVAAMMERVPPDVIFNCAVVGVDDCEADPALAERINVAGPTALARAAEHIGAAMVHFSTNYVFDGDRISGLYTVDDDALPVNVYGVTKLRGERAVAAAASRAFIVRTSWVFGAGGRNFLSTVAARLARGERVQAIVDTFASATSVTDLVARVMELVDRGRYGTYHVVNDGICSYESFAREAARLVQSGDGLIETVTEASLARPARRPRWTPMRCRFSEELGLPPLRAWEKALSELVGAVSL